MCCNHFYFQIAKLDLHLCQSLSDFEQIFREIWQREDSENAAFIKAPPSP